MVPCFRRACPVLDTGDGVWIPVFTGMTCFVVINDAVYRNNSNILQFKICTLHFILTISING